MSVRRTVAQSSAGLLLLAAFAAGPTAVYAAPDASDGGGDGEQPSPSACEDGTPASASADTSSYETNGTVTITGTCFPGHEPVSADILVGHDEVNSLESQTPSGSGIVSFSFEPGSEGTYTAVLSNKEDIQADVDFTIGVDGSDGNEGDDPDGNEGGNENDSGDDAEDSSNPDEGDEGTVDEDPDSVDDSQEQGDDEVVDDDGSDIGDDARTGDSGSDDEQKQDNGNSNESGSTEDSEEEQQGGDTTASGSPNKPSADYEEDGDTSASAANDNAASRGNASAQPPAAPGSATNDFPAAQQEATADQKQSAALAVLMTKLFAGGVSTGSVGTTPDQARTVIDPSADASEIEVPAGSDTGGSSDDGSGSESSDGDALAATGSNMLVPAGIAAAAILLGAGLKIHQVRRGL